MRKCFYDFWCKLIFQLDNLSSPLELILVKFVFCQQAARRGARRGGSRRPWAATTTTTTSSVTARTSGSAATTTPKTFNGRLTL